MKKAENAGNGSYPQRDSTECEGYEGARSGVHPESEERAIGGPKLLERILDRNNLNNAYRRVKANKGAPGVDGMTVEEVLPWLKEHGERTAQRDTEAGRGEYENWRYPASRTGSYSKR